MPVATTYIRAKRVIKEEPTADDEVNRSFKAAEGPDAEVHFPLNWVVHSILLDLYSDQYVIPCAVIELLRDYNPFSSRTGLTKKQVTKYLRILLDQTPELADNIIARLPDGRDLLPPELLARIPPPGNPDTPATPLSTAPSAISQFIVAPPPKKKPVSRLPAKRQQTNVHEDFVPKVGRQCSIPLVIPVKPPLVQKPDKPIENRDMLNIHPHPPPLSPCHKIFTLASSSSSSAKNVPPKDVSTNCIPVASTRVGKESISTPTMPDVKASTNSQANSFFSLAGWASGDASRITSVLPKENINSCGDTSDGQACEKEKITQFNFNSMLPALASVMENPDVPKPVKSMNEYDPLLAFGSDKLPRARFSESVKVSRQIGTLSESKTTSTTSSQILPDNLLFACLANGLKAAKKDIKVPKTSCPKLVIPSISSQTKPAQNPPSIFQSSANFLNLNSNANSKLKTLLSPSFPPPPTLLSPSFPPPPTLLSPSFPPPPTLLSPPFPPPPTLLSPPFPPPPTLLSPPFPPPPTLLSPPFPPPQNTFISPPHLIVSSASPPALPKARNVDNLLYCSSEKGSPTTLPTGEDEIGSLFLANSMPKFSKDI